MDADFLPYLLPGFIFLCALGFVAVRLKWIFTPFHCCLALLIAEVVSSIFPLLPVDRFGRTHIEAPSSTAMLILCGSAVTLFGLSLFIRPPKRYALTDFVLIPRFPRVFIITALLGVVFVSTVITLKKLGNFPMFVLSQTTTSQQIGYDDVFSGAITYSAWGAGRILGNWMLLEIAVSKDGFVRVFRKQALLAAAAALALLLNVLDGQRNPVVLMMLSGLFVLSLKGLVRPAHLIGGLLAITLLFSVVGRFRRGQEKVDILAVTSGNDSIDELGYFVVSYIEPNLPNLDNLVRLSPKPAYGAIFLSGVVQHAVISLFMPDPIPAVAILAESKVTSQPGQTFRTAYADFYADFGAFGSVLAVALVFGIAVFVFNRAADEPRCMLGFLIVAPCIVFIPMMNFAYGLAFVVQFLLFFLVSFRKTTRNSEGHPNMPKRHIARFWIPERYELTRS